MTIIFLKNSGRSLSLPPEKLSGVGSISNSWAEQIAEKAITDSRQVKIAGLELRKDQILQQKFNSKFPNSPLGFSKTSLSK